MNEDGGGVARVSSSGGSTRAAFQAGGTLREDALYVERPADKELPEALLRCEFCYVLAPRQIGKSSLRVRTAQRLNAAGVRTVNIDLTTIGSRNSTAAQWYYGLLQEIADQLRLPPPDAFWKASENLSPVHRWSRYLGQELIAQIPQDVVIFIDEIDSVLALEEVSRDDFFGSVRAVYNQRAQDPSYKRLTFCLIGVAMPSDLVEDETRTPFNIGRAITLPDFTRAEMEAFLPSLAEQVPDPRKVVEEIFRWTSGHPYMAQTICQALCEGRGEAGVAEAMEPMPSMPSGRTQRAAGIAPQTVAVIPAPPGERSWCAADRVAQVVGLVFLRKGRVLEPNLAYAEKSFSNAEAERASLRITRGGDSRVSRADTRMLLREARTAAMLQLYGRLRTGQRVPADGHDLVQMALRLTGMAKEQTDRGGTYLIVRNLIFTQVFESSWVRDLSAKRTLATPLMRWLESDRRPEFLLRGDALKAAQGWALETKELTREESAFLKAAERAETQARRQALASLYMTALFKHFATYLLLLVIRDWMVKYRGFTPERAQTLYSWIFAANYILSAIGGPLSDFWLRHRRAVQLSLGLMALGYFLLTVGGRDVMYLAMFLICIGNGLYKPGFVALVGSHYPPDDTRQDTAYLIYYLCLNAGAALAPLARSTLLQGTPAAFSASGVAMIIGLLLFQRYPEAEAPRLASSWDTPRPDEGIRAAAALEVRAQERSRLKTLVVVLGAVALPFWMAFYQSGDSANRWIESHNSLIDRLFDPTAKRQVSAAVNPAFVVLLTPFLWGAIELSRRWKMEPGTQAKLALGMLLTAASLVLIGLGLAERSSVFLGVYCTLSIAELLLTPISYALVVRLAPPRFLATAMGIWFLVMISANELTAYLRDIWMAHGGSIKGYVLLLAGMSAIAATIVYGAQLRGAAQRTAPKSR